MSTITLCWVTDDINNCFNKICMEYVPIFMISYVPNIWLRKMWSYILFESTLNWIKLSMCVRILMCYFQKLIVFSLFSAEPSFAMGTLVLPFLSRIKLCYGYTCDRGYTSRVALKILVCGEISYNLEFSTFSQGDRHLRPYTCGYTYCMWRLI